MPALTPAEKARYRTTPHASQKYLYAFVPTVIFAAEVNNAPAPGAVNIDYDTVTVGAYTVIEGGETLLVGSSAGGSDIGRLRVRGATAGHLIVAWDSDILWSNNQHLTVLREFLPWRRQQRTVAGVVTKDYDVSWTGQTTQWPPAPLMGDATIKLFRPGDPSPQLYMADRGSYPMAPGATITGHAWVMPGGTPATSASSTPGLVTVSAPIKDYWKLSITDSNGKVSSGRRPFVVVDPANCYTEFVCESLEDNIDGGVVARFRVFGDAPVSAFPSRASIFYFTEDYYGDGHGEHIKFFGYIVERSVKKDPETSDITFTAVSCVSIADKLVVSASELQDVVTPSSWQQAKSLTVRRSLFYLIYFHSTLFQVADVAIVDDPTPDWYVVFPEGTLWGLMNTFARTWRALRCGVTKRGRVVIGVDPQMRAVADRGVVTQVMQLQHGDWHGEIDPVITDFPPYAFLDVNGDYYDGVPGVSKELPVLSIAPGHPDKEFGGKDAFPGMISNGQLESNQFAGLMLGQKNNPYSPFKIELVGNWWEAFEPAFQEYLVAPAGGWPTNAFPALLDSARLIVRGMSQSDAPDGVQLTTLLVEPESFPEQAVDGDYPPPFTPPCDDCPIPCVGCDPPAPVAPTVDFVGDPLSGCVPFTVTFTPAIGGGTATGYLWDFGDGGFSTLANPTHSYTVAGLYTVTLGVDFLEGDYVEVEKVAYITVAACNNPPLATGGIWTLFANGEIYKLTALAADAGAATAKPNWNTAQAPTYHGDELAPALGLKLVLIADAGNAYLVKSLNDGDSWTVADTGVTVPNGGLPQIQTDRSNRNLVWATNDVHLGGVLETSIKDALAVQVSLSGTFGNGATEVDWFTNARPLYVWISTNGGTSYTAVLLDYLFALLPTRMMYVGPAAYGAVSYDTSLGGDDYAFFIAKLCSGFGDSETVWDTGASAADLGIHVDSSGVGPYLPLAYKVCGLVLTNPSAGVLQFFAPNAAAILCPLHNNAGLYVVLGAHYSVDTITQGKSYNHQGAHTDEHITEYASPLAYYAGSVSPANVSITYVYKVTSGGSFARQTITGFEAVYAVTDVSNTDRLYLSDNFDHLLHIYIWSTQSHTTKAIPGAYETGLFVTSQGTLLVGRYDGHILRSTNQGTSWSDITLGDYPYVILMTEYGGTPGTVGPIVLKTDDSSGKYYYSLDDGLTWILSGDLAAHQIPLSNRAR